MKLTHIIRIIAATAAGVGARASAQESPAAAKAAADLVATARRWRHVARALVR